MVPLFSRGSARVALLGSSAGSSPPRTRHRPTALRRGARTQKQSAIHHAAQRFRLVHVRHRGRAPLPAAQAAGSAAHGPHVATEPAALRPACRMDRVRHREQDVYLGDIRGRARSRDHPPCLDARRRRHMLCSGVTRADAHVIRGGDGSRHRHSRRPPPPPQVRDQCRDACHYGRSRVARVGMARDARQSKGAPPSQPLLFMRALMVTCPCQTKPNKTKPKDKVFHDALLAIRV